MHFFSKEEFVSVINELWTMCGGARRGGSKNLAIKLGIHFTTVDRWRKGAVDSEKLTVGQMNHVLKVAEDIRNKVDVAMRGKDSQPPMRAMKEKASGG
jgi:hypothetical protein